MVENRKRNRNGVTQQVECLVPVGSKGLFDNGGLTEVGTVDCYDCEGIREGENVTFDETVNGEYLVMGGSETKEENMEERGREPTSESN